jgi:hypothetical protein
MEIICVRSDSGSIYSVTIYGNDEKERETRFSKGISDAWRSEWFGEESNMADWEKELRLPLSDLKLDPMQEAEIVEEFSLRLEDRFTELLAQGATEIQAKRIALDELLKDLSLFRELQPGDRAARIRPCLV